MEITDCVRYPSHTTGHAVFRIRRLNPATYNVAKSDGTLSLGSSPSYFHSAPSIPPTPMLQLAFHFCAESTNLTQTLVRMATAVVTFVHFGILRALIRSLSLWSVFWFFRPSLCQVSKASSLLRLLLTSSKLSLRRSPRVRC